MVKNALRVVSLVPSWTETLIYAGINVVGRTRFCIHPEDLVKNIPQVAGTKDLNLDRIKALKPDLVIVDKEENTKEMAEMLQHSGIRLVVTQVIDFESVIKFCSEIGQHLESPQMQEIAERYKKVLPEVNPQLLIPRCLLRGDLDSMTLKAHCEYVIWKKPFMVIGENTFIAANLKLAGIQVRHREKYSTLSDSEIKNSYCLFSSEPYPFLKKYEQLIADGYRGVVVDGEKLSWFGIRNLNFLESC